MNTRDLAFFRAIVQYKNYTYVAERFSVSQPAVSQAIKRLEREFDAPLVQQDRVHHQTVITRAGMLLYQNAQAIQSSISLAHREIDFSKQSQIRFGLPPIIGALYFPQVAAALLRRGWMKQIKIVENGSVQLLTNLIRGDIDIALIGSPRPLHHQGVEAISLGARPFNVIVSPDNPLAQRQSISFAELGTQQFIGLDGKFAHPEAFRAYCKAAGITPNIVYRTPDIAWLKGIVRENLGLGFLVQDAVSAIDGVVGLKITDQLMDRFNVSIAYRQGYSMTPEETAFVKLLSQMRIPDPMTLTQ
ncbi:LysR family transcriptional regulator [Levilactobacillus zymae]|uniref:LysR family transcriptional regulator n=2 Tax=Levilactobacillus zymae TaxID=267363 RepID=A0ABQ0X4G6_9LACO|nr:LysR family transcriptional regulator [Levilactobacillus zymae]KRL12647.1 malolactic regulator [Levilactobacillus zymae DSM 19395]QFR61955.1 LysR family transcriptional regulator [Levilactobacillus zymae]GEO72363.1 LysR family transcriptional regulator [Levilactobacillus zymae]